MAKKTPLSIEDALALRQVSDPRLSPDGTRVVSVVTELDEESKNYCKNLWMVSAAGGDARPLTYGVDASVAPRWSPDGEAFAFLSDRTRGTEKEEDESQIWLLPMEGGEARRLTQAEGGVRGIQWFTRHYQQGTPWERASRYAAQSPMAYADRVSTPTLIWHGDEDRRVAVEQGEQLYVALRERGVPVEFVRYPRAGHGLDEYFHQRDLTERAHAWLDHYVRGRKR